ncbi:MAG: response regulator [Opitutae bacterium]|nr:response regulator [Opitutae bacterium]
MARILLIDDDDDLRDVTAEVLRQAGHAVNTAADGKAGLARHQAEQHDLIITDMMMPDMDGVELIMALRRAEPRPRVIAISGGSKFSEPLYLPVAQRLGVQRTLAKPIRAGVLLQAVAEVLAAPAPPTVPPPPA